jgi:hypothetical protein
VPITYSIDPYNGENITHTGYHVEQQSIQITIKNQPFTPYMSNGFTVDFRYNIRIKGHYSEDWNEIYLASDNGYAYQDLECEYTVILFSGHNSVNAQSMSIQFSVGDKVDFQIEAMIGYVSRVNDPTATGPNWYPWRLTGEKSGWSQTQTLTITDHTSTITSEPETQSNQPDQFALVVAGALVAIPVAAGLGLLIHFSRKK